MKINTYGRVSIDPGSEEALALTAADLRVMFYTGGASSHGFGKGKITHYREGIQTRVGDIELSQWRELVWDHARRSGEEHIIPELAKWELENTPWIHSQKEAEQRALERYCSGPFERTGISPAPTGGG